MLLSFSCFFSTSFVTDTEKVSTNLECISDCVVLCALDVAGLFVYMNFPASEIAC